MSPECLEVSKRREGCILKPPTLWLEKGDTPWSCRSGVLYPNGLSYFALPQDWRPCRDELGASFWTLDVTVGAEILNGTENRAARPGRRRVGWLWPGLPLSLSLGLGWGGRDLSSALPDHCQRRADFLPPSSKLASLGQSQGSGITWQRLRLKPHLIKTPQDTPRMSHKCLKVP